MGFPGLYGNWRGYEESDLTSKVFELIHPKNIFVIHGAGNDLFHHEQSMSLVKALVDVNVLFRQQVLGKMSHIVKESQFKKIFHFRFIHMMLIFFPFQTLRSIFFLAFLTFYIQTVFYQIHFKHLENIYSAKII